MSSQTNCLSRIFSLFLLFLSISFQLYLIINPPCHSDSWQNTNFAMVLIIFLALVLHHSKTSHVLCFIYLVATNAIHAASTSRPLDRLESSVALTESEKYRCICLCDTFQPTFRTSVSFCLTFSLSFLSSSSSSSTRLSRLHFIHPHPQPRPRSGFQTADPLGGLRAWKTKNKERKNGKKEELGKWNRREKEERRGGNKEW